MTADHEDHPKCLWDRPPTLSLLPTADHTDAGRGGARGLRPCRTAHPPPKIAARALGIQAGRSSTAIATSSLPSHPSVRTQTVLGQAAATALIP